MYVCVSYWHLIHNKFRERLSLNSPCLPKDIASKGAHLARIPYPGMLSTMEDGLLSQERKSHQPDKLCHRLSHLPSFLLKTHSSFLKVINSTIKNVFILIWHFLLNSKPPWRVTHFSLKIFHVYMRYRETSIYFYLINLFFVIRVSAMNSKG